MEMRDALLRRFELRKLIKESRGEFITDKIHSLNQSLQVLNGNYEELYNIVNEFKTNHQMALNIGTDESVEERSILFNTVTRYLHNFVSSAATLVDHTRNIINELYNEDDEFKTVYQNKMEEDLASSDVVNFIKNLRNYILHRNLPITYGQIAFTPGEAIAPRICLDKKELETFKNWNSLSKSYLANIDDKLDIQKMIVDYKTKIDSFYAWLNSEQLIIHQEDLNELMELENEQEEIYKLTRSFHFTENTK